MAFFDTVTKILDNITKFLTSYKYLPLILLVLSLWFLWKWVSCNFGIMKQRVWPVPTLKPYKEQFNFIADSILGKDTPEFIFEMFPGKSDFKSPSSADTPWVGLFSDEEDAIMKKEAIKFFKSQYGVSDTYLKIFMKRFKQNTLAGYQASYLSSAPHLQNVPVLDGGYLLYFVPGVRLHGKYGGKSGYTVQKPGFAPYGYYVLNDNLGNTLYKIEYKAICPLVTVNTYDGHYTVIDCDVKILEAPTNESLVGLTGKAQGMQKKFKLSNGKDHIVIRNLLVFD